MKRTYVTFGYNHIHEINGEIFDKDCVASIPCENRAQGREKAFELFGGRFCFEYHENEFDRRDLEFYPRGIVEVEAW